MLGSGARERPPARPGGPGRGGRACRGRLAPRAWRPSRGVTPYSLTGLMFAKLCPSSGSILAKLSGSSRPPSSAICWFGSAAFGSNGFFLPVMSTSPRVQGRVPRQRLSSFHGGGTGRRRRAHIHVVGGHFGGGGGGQGWVRT